MDFPSGIRNPVAGMLKGLLQVRDFVRLAMVLPMLQYRRMASGMDMSDVIATNAHTVARQFCHPLS